MYCNRIDDLFDIIINAKVQEPVYIGISLGFNPVEKTYEVVDMLSKLIDNLILKLKIVGIEATKLDLRKNYIFILDAADEKIITPSNQNVKQSTKKK